MEEKFRTMNLSVCADSLFVLSVPLYGGHDSQFKKRKAKKKKESKCQKVAFFTLTCEELFYWNKKCSVESQKKNMNKKKEESFVVTCQCHHRQNRKTSAYDWLRINRRSLAGSSSVSRRFCSLATGRGTTVTSTTCSPSLSPSIPSLVPSAFPKPIAYSCYQVPASLLPSQLQQGW